jgi:hypothetical protein
MKLKMSEGGVAQHGKMSTLNVKKVGQMVLSALEGERTTRT